MKLQWQPGGGWTHGYLRLWIWSPTKRRLRFVFDLNLGRPTSGLYDRRLVANDEFLTARW